MYKKISIIISIILTCVMIFSSNIVSYGAPVVQYKTIGSTTKCFINGSDLVDLGYSYYGMSCEIAKTRNGKYYAIDRTHNKITVITGKAVNTSSPYNLSGYPRFIMIFSKTTGEKLGGMVRCDGKYYIMPKNITWNSSACSGKVRCDGKYYICSTRNCEVLFGKCTYQGNTYITSKTDGHIFMNQVVTCNGVKYSCDNNGIAKRIR